MSLAETENRIQKLLDDELSEEEFAVLETELINDTEAMPLYLRYAKVHCGLESHFSFVESVNNISAELLDSGRLPKGRTRKGLALPLLAAAAVMVLLAVLVWSLKSPTAALEPSLAVLKSTDDAEFVVVHAHGEGSGAGAGLVLREGSQLSLDAGRVEGAFHSGVRFVVEAPCDLKVLREGLVELEKGVAWFEVPVKAKGFTVESSQLRVVDLGTVFGVVSDAAGGDEAHVIKGAVRAEFRNVNAAKNVATLEAGEALRVNEQGEFERLAANESLFRSVLKDPPTITVGGNFTDFHSYTPQSQIHPEGPQLLAGVGEAFRFTSKAQEGVLAQEPLVIRILAMDRQTGDDAQSVQTGLVVRAEKGRLALGVGDGSGVGSEQHVEDGEVGFDELQDDETLSLIFNYDVRIRQADFAGFGQFTDRQVWQVEGGAPMTIAGGEGPLDFLVPAKRLLSGDIPAKGLLVPAGKTLTIRGANSSGVKSDNQGTQIREGKGDGLLRGLSMQVFPESKPASVQGE